MIVAIDGPAASGKGTLARRLAADLNLAYLDTGSLYRATGLAVLRAGGSLDSEADAVAAARTLDVGRFSPDELRSEEAGVAASRVAFRRPVREALLEYQRRFAHQPPPGKSGVVMDGRDIGTHVFPNADVKFFFTARPDVRAVRRHDENVARGCDETLAETLAALEERDRRDSTRNAAPLRRAEDAVEIDTTELSREAIKERLLEIVTARM